MRTAIILALAILAGACNSDVDEPWFLDHDRIIAVRASKPGLLAGEQAQLDALIGRKGASPAEEVPPAAMVISPESLASALRFDAGQWIVTAPDDATLAQVRTELGLEADKPVPLVVGTAWPAEAFPMDMNGNPFTALKTVYLGVSAENPVLDDMTVNGIDAGATSELVVGKLVDVPLSVAATDDDIVNWLTSCGTMHDFDLPQAYLRVEKEDMTEGDLAVVVRTQFGGVAWKVWPIRAE
ncbi:MAG: hypothetical protein AB7T06_00555 [Kofleriaceae bacterium]